MMLNNTFEIKNIFKELKYKIIYDNGISLDAKYKKDNNLLCVSIIPRCRLITVYKEYNNNKEKKEIKFKDDITEKELKLLLKELKF